MKALIIALLLALSSSTLFAQKIEVTAGVYGDSFKFRGEATEATSFINDASTASNPHGYTNNPFGNKTGYGYGVQAQAQFIIFKSLVVGVQGAYEQTRSRTDITQVNYTGLTPGGPVSLMQDANGVMHIKSNNIVVAPYIGFRLPLPVVRLDVLFGLETGYVLNAREKSSAIGADGNLYTTDLDRRNLKKDKRLRFGLNAGFKRFSIFGNVAYGHSNYMADYVGGGPHDARSTIGRLGIGYRIW